jgi:arabinose-5-phosphate isomerase
MTVVRHALLSLLTMGVEATAGSGVWGCGSNVVDRFFRVRAIPKVGEKGFFDSPTKILETSVVGGVTLNHLAWAAELGVPCGLLALQGDDDAGRLVRSAMDDVRVSAECVEVSQEYTTAESYVLSQPHDGERSIIMASGSTSQIDGEAMSRLFERATALNAPLICTTEVSQVPLSGVEALLLAGNACGALTVLDVDVSPSVCVDEARLGSLDDLKRCVKLARVVKPTRHAAVELLQLLRGDSNSDAVEDMDAATLASALREASGAAMVALTAGSAGSALATSLHCAVVEACSIREAIDATGAGDAFLGGLLAGLYERATEDEGEKHDAIWSSMVPSSRDDLVALARFANAAGAACCESIGGLPTDGAKARVLQLRGGSSDGDGGGGPSRMSGPLRGAVDIGNKPMQEMDAFTQSLAMDAVTLSHMMRDEDNLYGSIGGSGGGDTSASCVIAAILGCRGRVHVTGIGKSGIVGRRLAASLASTGTPAHWTHASEWAHGDLGNAAVHGDLIIALSHSGTTAEVLAACRHLQERGVHIYAITSRSAEGSKSPLETLSEAALTYTLPKEGALAVEEPLGGAPTCSVIAQEALSNALVCELIARRTFSREDFKRNHP